MRQTRANKRKSKKTYDRAKQKLAKNFSINFDERLNNIYINPTGADKAYPGGKDKTFDCKQKIIDELIKTPLRSLLVLGNSGMGKSCLSLQLCKEIWHMIDEGKELDGTPLLPTFMEQLPLPLYIYLPHYKSSLTGNRLLEKALEKQLQESERLAILQHPLLLILDGFDEVNINFNLYTRQGWGTESRQIKVLITCRPEALTPAALNRDHSKPPLNRQALFEASSAFGSDKANFKKIYLQPFNEKNMEEYFEKYLNQRNLQNNEAEYLLSVDDYMASLEKLPSLKALVTTPFLLVIVASILPSILKNCENQPKQAQYFTQTQLFKNFLNKWFLKQAKRVERLFNGSLSQSEIEGYMHAYAKNLAKTRLDRNGQLNESPLTEVECLNIELIEPTHNPELLKNYRAGQSRCFFTEDTNGKKIPIIEHIQAIRSGCLLQTIDEHFKFLHKSITEYLAATELMEGFLGEASHYINRLISRDGEEIGLNRALIKEPQMLSCLAESVQAQPRFKELLQAVLNASKNTPGIATAAANAITILNRTQVSFAWQNLSDVQIPGADLSNGVFIGTQFTHANLAGVNFRQANLTNAIFRGANLENIDFGEKVYGELNSYPNCIACYQPDENTLHYLVGCNDGYVYRFDDKTMQVVAKLRYAGYGEHKEKAPINALQIHQGNIHRLVTAGSDGKICLWNLKTNKYIKTLTGHTSRVTAVTISLDGHTLISASWDNTLRLWDFPSGNAGMVLNGHTDSVTAVTISPDGHTLISASEDKTLRLWDFPSGNARMVLNGHTSRVTAVTISPDGHTLISASWNTFRLWDFPSGNARMVLNGHTDSVTAVTISPDGHTLISASWDNTLRLWDFPSGNAGMVLKRAH